ncbi:AAA family ATPase [Candidatus Woesearchaeota archaeon]|nr:AAA family ATPase [Candidatus Woesearchaeota archaeon]
MAAEAQSKKGQKYLDVSLERDELSRNLGGGLPKNSLMLLEGQDGAGKSILAQRLAYSFVNNGATVTYISTELNTMTFVEQMGSLDYDINKAILNGELLFIPMFPLLGHTNLEPDFFQKLVNSKEVFRSEVIIFDTLSFLMIHNTMGHKEAFNIINLLKRYTSLGKTIIFCVDDKHLNETFLTLVRSVCDIYMTVEVKGFAGQSVRVVSTHRFKRPESAFMPAIPFKIEPGQGLTIEIASFE